MSKLVQGVSLIEQIRKLQGEREKHASAIARIDAVLTQVTSALNAAGGGAISPVAGTTPARRTRGRFAQTAEQSVLEFINKKGAPSTAEINLHWRQEGRKGTANVLLLKLLKQRTIERQADPSVRGSRYALKSAKVK